jgi:ribonucleoside-diphosphate reductase alpha chain
MRAGFVATAMSLIRNSSMTDHRERLPKDRASVVHGFKIGQLDCTLIVGFYDDCTPGELFLKIAKAGSALRGAYDSFGTAISVALQYGAPLSRLADKFKESKFEPAGYIDEREYSSILDYVFRYIEKLTQRVIAAAA